MASLPRQRSHRGAADSPTAAPGGAPRSQDTGVGGEGGHRGPRAEQAPSRQPLLPTSPFPTASVLLLPPVDDVVLVKVLQALQDLQDDALHLETEDRSTGLCKSSTSRATPRRGGVRPTWVPCGLPRLSLLCSASVPVSSQQQLAGCLGHVFAQFRFPASLLQPRNPPGKSLEPSVRAS